MALPAVSAASIAQAPEVAPGARAVPVGTGGGGQGAKADPDIDVAAAAVTVMMMLAILAGAVLASLSALSALPAFDKRHGAPSPVSAPLWGPSGAATATLNATAPNIAAANDNLPNMSRLPWCLSPGAPLGSPVNRA